MQLSNEKDINLKDYYQCTQIKNAVETLKFNLDSLYVKDNSYIITLANHLYVNCPTKWKKFFGKNLALTLFPQYSILLLKDFINQSCSLISKEAEFTSSTLSLLWNSTDCSEKFVEKLLNISNFKESLSIIINKTNLSEEKGYDIVLSAVNIVNNVVRREAFRHSFDGFNLSDRILDMIPMDQTAENWKLALTFMICFVFSSPDKICLGDLHRQFEGNVLIYLDGVSNTDDFRYQNFSSVELLEMIKVSSDNEDMKNFYSSNPTLKMTLLRFLNRDHQIDLVMSIIDRLYDQHAIRQIENLYIAKNGKENGKIMAHFDCYRTSDE